MAPAANTQTARQTLIVGTKMRCPRCKNLHDILDYRPMAQIEEFASETNAVYKCPSCRWIFSPAAHFLESMI